MNKSENLDFNSLLKLAVISVITAVGSFIIIFYFSNYASLFFAYDFDIPASFNLNGITFADGSGNMNWSRDALITILLSKPMAAFIVGIVAFIILLLKTKKPTTITFLLFWLSVYAFNSVFGVLIDDIVTHVGIYEAASIMNLDSSYLLIMLIILTFVFLKIGMMNGRLMILSFPGFNLFSFQSRVIFFIFVLLTPVLLVAMYTYFTSGLSFPISNTLKTFPVLLLIAPFLIIKNTINTKFHYLPANQLSVIDIILTASIITLSVALFIEIKDGIMF
ncbi:MAG: hypothetical protein QM503_03020 [Bacteroidota bacterium]